MVVVMVRECRGQGRGGERDRVERGRGGRGVGERSRSQQIRRAWHAVTCDASSWREYGPFKI